MKNNDQFEQTKLNPLQSRKTRRSIPLLTLLVFLLMADFVSAGTPATGLLLCCRGNDRGSFLINGQWEAQHDYRDINQVRGILQDIKDAGINLVIIDMTNASMWVRNFDVYGPMIDNIRTVTSEKNMEYFIMTGIVLTSSVRNEPGMPAYMQTIDQVEFWNNIAEIIWNDYAPDPQYRTYGFGDNRKILGLFYPGELVFGANGNGGIWANAPAAYKTYLSLFYRGTNEYNQDFQNTPTDGWGYRDIQQNSDGKIRFASPTSGLSPSSSTRLNAQQWGDRIDWAASAEHYSVYGSYDDSFDNIQWGINDTQSATTSKDIYYPGNDPYYYYDVLKDKLSPTSNCTSSGTQWNMNSITEFGNSPSSSVSNLTASGGILSYNVVGADPFVYSQDNLGYCTNSNSQIEIRMKNGTSANNLRVYFATNASPNLSEAKSVGINISTNDASFQVYTLDMSTNANWTGTLKQLRLDAPNGSASGTVDVDYIRLGTASQAPSVSFNTPSNNASFSAPANVSVDVNATDDGSIANVQLFLNGTFVRQENAAPYTWGGGDPALNNMAAGTYALRAVATDNNGLTGEETINITVQSAGPTVSFTQPTQTQFNAGDDLGVVAYASDGTTNGQNISNVRLSFNGQLVRQENVAPYEWGTANPGQTDAQLYNLTAGTHQLSLVATNTQGVSSTATMTINVAACNDDLPWSDADFNISATTVNYNSGAIDISCASNATLSLDIAGVIGSMETNQDYLTVSYSVDGGSPVTIANKQGNFNAETLSVTGISGSTLVLYIDGYTSVASEVYEISNISVVEGGSGARHSSVSKTIAEKEVSDNMVLYPNPAEGFVNLSLGKPSETAIVEIYNTGGSIVLRKTVTGGESTLNINALRSGLYVVKVSFGEILKTRKLYIK